MTILLKLSKLLALFGLFSFLNASVYSSKEWITLLHYHKTFNGYISLVDDKNFFISKNGKYNPKDEFLSSIKLIKTNPQKFACKFPLRYTYLNSKLHLNDFNITQCPKLQKFLKTVNANKATLVFADADVNKPASMFGHTFIRFDNDKFSPYLSYAVNYAATVTDTNGILFAFKGVFGYYKAYYSILPYYEKIKQYSNKDSRDLWEYELNFTPSQVNKMLLHVWELKNIYSDYYFFNENCSYNILYLIDVVNPEIDSTNYFYSLTVIPLDTAKYLYKKGLITKETYRPSLMTKIETVTKKLSNQDILLIKKIASGKTKPKIVKINIKNPKNQAKILDASVRYLEFLSKKTYIPKKVYTKRFLNILKVRSKIDVISNYKYPTPPNPLNSHDSKRIRISIGKDNKFFTQINYRMSYHQLDDIDTGYKKWSSLSFGNFALRIYKEKINIQKIGLIEIKSLSKRDILFKPISWKVNVGFYQKYTSRDNKHLTFNLNTGGGFTQKFNNFYFYSILSPDLLINKHFSKGYSLGIGLDNGIIYSSKNYKILLTFLFYRYLAGDIHSFFKNSLLITRNLNQNNSITFQIKNTYTFSKNHLEGLIGFNHYF